MSTGPGPTRKADGTDDASVDDIADLLVEDDPSGVHAASEEAASEETSEETSADSLDVMLETPGPALANPFMPPPPSPVGDAGDESESAEENGAATNLAYEDLLAKLVLPAKAPEPEPEMPALMSSLPLPEPADTPQILPPPTFPSPPAQSLQLAPPAEEQTLVTENPLVAEEQEAAVREGRSAWQPVPVHEDMRTVPTEPVVVGGNVVAAKSRLVYLMLGGLLVLGGMILAVLVLKLLMPTPAPQPPAVVAPTPPPPPPPSPPPAHVEPLPPSAPPAAVAPTEPQPGAQPETLEAVPEAVPTVEPERAPPRPHRPAARPKASRPTSSKAAAARSTPKAAPASKPAKSSKSSKKAGKLSGYADPFDN
jgi:hypothetical protein